MGYTAIAVPVTGDGVVRADPTRLHGLSLVDGSSAANTVVIYDNASAASGTILFTGVIAANGGLSLETACLWAYNGLYLATTGAVTGSIWVG